MRGRRRPERAVVVLVMLLSLVVACGTGSGDVATTSTPVASAATYCADLRKVVQVLDDGGSTAEYDRLLARVVDASPPRHAATWTLMLRLSVERFSYENFNPAVDSLDRISADLDATCPGLGRFVVDDDGRMRQQPGK